ncbi:hypothetical protein AGMMS49928_13150 [Spirochaetia bacterium]|nr:hypothetical protein AGMMS49928_13150 [Spirochaetia bacterium]
MTKLLKIGIFSLFFTIFAAGLQGQQSTAEEVEIILNTSALRWDHTARFVLEAADVAAIKEPAEAFGFALERGWIPKNARPADPVRLNGLSLLLMRSFDLNGGWFYSIFKNPHYAYRELMYQDILPPGTDPAMQVSGERLLYMIGRILAITEAERQRLVATLNKQIARGSGAVTATVEVTKEGVSISLTNLQFQADDSTLTNTEKAKLKEIARILKILPQKKLLVAGHTALAGSEDGRLSISQNRAQAVADYLIHLRVRRPDEITVRGYGAIRPLADNATPEGMARNRRVEIIILE